MSDPIERQDVIDEAEKWIEAYNSGRGGQRERDAIKHVISGIKKLPSAQPEVLACGEGELITQTEIVRCKECKYWNDEFAKDKSTCWLPCMSMTTHRKWYCGSAERRTDD